MQYLRGYSAMIDLSRAREQPRTEKRRRPMRLAVAMLIALAISIGGQGIARAASNVITITDISFPQEMTQSSGVVLIHFYADWVRGSRILSPTLDAIAGV